MPQGPDRASLTASLEADAQECLTLLSCYNTVLGISGRLGYLTTNRLAEPVYMRLLNMLYGWELKSRNRPGHNEPMVDLVDDRNRIAVQVTSTCSGQKINETLASEKAEKWKEDGYNLKLCFCGRQDDAKKVKSEGVWAIYNPHEIDFDRRSDALFTEDLVDRFANPEVIDATKREEVLRFLWENVSLPYRGDPSKDMAEDARLFVRLSEVVDYACCRGGGYCMGDIQPELFPSLLDIDTGIEHAGDGVATTPLWECLRPHLDRTSNRVWMLVGEGGIGKTVAMLQTACLAACDGRYVVHVPLRDLHCAGGTTPISDHIQQTVLRGDEGLWNALLSHIDHDIGDRGGAEILLLLDGWNEIVDRVVDGFWLTDILRDEIEREWMPRPNVAVVLAGRERADADGGWANHQVTRLHMNPLAKEAVAGYLKSNGVEPPQEGDPMWNTLANTLMLTLHVATEPQREEFGGHWATRFMGGENHWAQAAVMWNYLQCQIGKFSRYREDRGYQCVLAVDYAAACVGHHLEREREFSMSVSELRALLRDAENDYLESWKNSAVLNGHTGIDESLIKWDVESLIKILCDETVLLCRTGDETPMVEFAHQKFRDCCAAMFLKVQLPPFGTKGDATQSACWTSRPASPEVLRLLSCLYDTKELGQLWEATRGRHLDEGGYERLNILELLRTAEAYDTLANLDFSGQDLRSISLHNYVRDASGLDFRGSLVSKRTLMPPGHPSMASKLAWIPGDALNDAHGVVTVARDLRLWNVLTSSLVIARQDHESGITCVAASRDGKVVATGSHDGTVVIYPEGPEAGRHIRVRVPQPPSEKNDEEEGSQDLVVPTTLAFVTEEALMAGLSDGNICLIDLGDGQPACTKLTIHLSEIPEPHWAAIHELAVGREGVVAARVTIGAGERSGTGRVISLRWDKARARLIEEHGFDIDARAIRFSADGQLYALAGDDGSIIALAPHEGEMRELSRTGRAVRVGAFSPEGTYVAQDDPDGPGILLAKAASDEGPVTLASSIDGKDGDEYHDEVVDIAFSPEGKRLAALRRGGLIEFWNVSDASPSEPLKPYRKLGGYPQGFTSVVMGPSGGLLTSFGRGRLLELSRRRGDVWACTRNKPVFGFDVRTLVGTPEDSFLLGFGAEQAALVDARTWEVTHRFDLSEGGGIRAATLDEGAMNVYLSFDNGWIAHFRRVDDHSYVRLQDVRIPFEPREGRDGAEGPEGSDRVTAMLLDDDGRLIAGTHQGRIVVWNASTMSPEGCERPFGSDVRGMCPLDDSHVAVAVHLEGVFIYDVGREARIVPLSRERVLWQRLASSPMHDMLACGSLDPSLGERSELLIAHRDISDGKWMVGSIEVRSNCVGDMCVMPDGTIAGVTMEGDAIIADKDATTDTIRTLSVVRNLPLLGARFQGTTFVDDGLKELVHISGGLIE